MEETATSRPATPRQEAAIQSTRAACCFINTRPPVRGWNATPTFRPATNEARVRTTRDAALATVSGAWRRVSASAGVRRTFKPARAASAKQLVQPKQSLRINTATSGRGTPLFRTPCRGSSALARDGGSSKRRSSLARHEPISRCCGRSSRCWAGSAGRGKRATEGCFLGGWSWRARRVLGGQCIAALSRSSGLGVLLLLSLGLYCVKSLGERWK